LELYHDCPVKSQKHLSLARLDVFAFHPAQMFRVVASDVKAIECDALIAGRAGVQVVPQVVQTCENHKNANRSRSSTRLRTIKSGKTLGFYDSTFSEIQIVDTRKPAQTRIDIGFADDGL
jgi:hypothetical protein